MSRSTCYLVILGLGVSSLGLPSYSQEAKALSHSEEKLRISWTDARIESASRVVTEVSKGRLSILCDSYDSDATRTTQAPFEDTPHAIVQRVARSFERQLIRRDGHCLIRHDRWFDLQFAAQPGNPRERKPAKRGAIRVSESGKNVLLDVDLTRLPLQDLALQLKGVTKTPHSVALPLRVRRVSGRLTAISPDGLRDLIATLYPDSEWRQRGGAWFLEERESAELTRALAAEGASHSGYEMRPRAALYVQTASELNAAQLAKLSKDGRIRVSWAELSITSRDLLEQRATAFLDVIDRSNKSRDYFLDFNRKETWGVELQRGQDGPLKATAYGRTRVGPLVVF